MNGGFLLVTCWECELLSSASSLILRSLSSSSSFRSQVWLLTQFYPVDFSKSWISVEECVFNKRTIKVYVSCFWRYPGTSAASAAHLMVSLYLCSSESNARGEARNLKGHSVCSKSPSRVRDRDKGVAGRNRREKYFPEDGSLICSPGKSLIFYTKNCNFYQNFAEFC